MGKLSEQDKEEIRQAYFTDLTSTQLAEKYQVTRGMITKVWYDAKLHGKPVKYSNPRSTDLTGQKFERLTVIEKSEFRSASGGIKWKCQCDCGNICYVESSRLRNGKAKSCGCLSKESLKKGRGSNFIDLTGQRFGHLTVIKKYENEDKVPGVEPCYDNHQIKWICKCDCGRFSIVITSNLRKGNSQSCGHCGNNSHGNTRIESLLLDAGIPFVREKRFDSCKDKAALPFDFFVDDKYLIEYDGKQHFQKDSLFDFEGTKKRDLIKSKWCKDNNIPLIRIPYTHYKDLAIEDLKLETSTFIEK